MAVEAVNEVKIARTATPGTNRKLAGHVRVGAGDKGRHFLVADQNPFNGLLSAEPSVIPLSESPTIP